MRACRAAAIDAPDRLEAERLREPFELGDRRREILVGRRPAAAPRRRPRWAAHLRGSRTWGADLTAISSANAEEQLGEPPRRLGMEHVAGAGDDLEPRAGQRIAQAPRASGRKYAADRSPPSSSTGVCDAWRARRSAAGTRSAPRSRRGSRRTSRSRGRGRRAACARTRRRRARCAGRTRPRPGPPCSAAIAVVLGEERVGAAGASSEAAIGGSISTAPSSGRRRITSSATTAPKLEPTTSARLGRGTSARARPDPRRWSSSGRSYAIRENRCASTGDASWIDHVVWSAALPWISNTRVVMAAIIGDRWRHPDDDRGPKSSSSAAFAATVAPASASEARPMPTLAAPCGQAAATARGRRPSTTNATARSRAAAWAGSSPPRIAGSAARSRSRSCSSRPATSCRGSSARR